MRRLGCPGYLSRCRQSPADMLWFPCLHTPRRLRRSPHRESSAPPYFSHILLKMVSHPAFARTFCEHTMELTAVAVCAPARLSGLHAALSPVPRRHAVAPSRRSNRDSSLLVDCFRVEQARCRWRTSSGSRYCSLRVPQPVVGEHTVSLHAPSAGGRGRRASRSLYSWGMGHVT